MLCYSLKKIKKIIFLDRPTLFLLTFRLTHENRKEKVLDSKRAPKANTLYFYCVEHALLEFVFEFNAGSCKNKCLNAQVHMYIICSSWQSS